MGIYIKGMKMPESCYTCELKKYCHMRGKFLGYGVLAVGRLEDCPLVEVPEPHGRLIDADILYENIDRLEYFSIWVSTPASNTVKRALRAMPTVIEAEGE